MHLKLKGWQQRLQRQAEDGREVVLWGSGSKAVAFLSSLSVASSCVSRVVDINPFRQGHFLPGSGVPIVAPAALADAPPDVVIIMNAVYRGEVADQLNKLGVAADVLTL
jgi:hypothetical protein